MEEAAASLSEVGIKSYLEGASLVCMIGRGFEPVLVYLEEMPQVAARLGEPVLGLVSQSVWKISRTPNGAIILPFLQTLPEAARRLGSEQQLVRYIDMLLNLLERTSSSIHGGQATIPSPGAKEYLQQMPYLLNQLSLEGIRNWTEYGIRNYSNHPERQKDFFSLQSADSRAMLQRERHGTLFADHERQLDLYLRALWQDKDHLVPYSTAFDELRKPIPYYDSLGIRLPDVFDDTESGVHGIDRYRAVLAHIAAHRRWSHFIFADNFSPFQRIAIELLEDSRMEYLAMQQYPGLRQLWLALHPVPIEGECDRRGVLHPAPPGHALLRHSQSTPPIPQPGYPERGGTVP